MKLRTLVAGAVAFPLGMGLLACAQAQEFPARPLRILVGYPPGGVPDVVARYVGGQMAPLLGQAVNVENKPGAGGLLAAQEVIKSAPDGYTFLMASSTDWGIMPALRPGIYDPVSAFTPLCGVGFNALMLSVKGDFAAKNFQEFVAMAKAKPGSLRYASGGTAGFHHLYMESLKAALGIDLVHIPYKGGPAMSQALAAGDVEVTAVALITSGPLVRAGKLRYIAISTAERSPLAPTVPSMREVGVPDLHFAATIGFVGPAGLPKPVLDRLAGSCAKVAQTAEFNTRAAESFGMDPAYRNPAELAEIIRADIPRYARAVKISGAKLD